MTTQIIDKSIVCSAEKGEMPALECLQCALSHGSPPCGYDYSLLTTIYSADRSLERAGEIHVTDLTGCLRKAYYDKREPSPEFPHERLVRWLGTAIHAESEVRDEWMESEISLEADGIVGKADILYYDGRLVEKKTTRWLKLGSLPYGSHALQLNIYAWMLRRSGRAVSQLQVQYIDASGPTKCRKCGVPVRMIAGELKCPVCLASIRDAHLGAVMVDIPVMTDREVEEIVIPRRDELQSSLDMGILPERETVWLCRFCSHADKCLGGTHVEYE